MRRVMLILLFLAAVTSSAFAQSPPRAMLVDGANTPIPLSTVTEVPHDSALGTVTSIVSTMMECRARATAGSDVSADDDAALVECTRGGFLINAPAANTFGGATPNFYVSTASNNSTNIKASAGQVYSITAVNVTASLKYIRLYNLSSAPTCTSSTGIVFYSPIPGSTTNPVPLTVPVAVGSAFSAGIGFCITGGAGVTDNTSTAAGDVILNYAFK